MIVLYSDITTPQSPIQRRQVEQIATRNLLRQYLSTDFDLAYKRNGQPYLPQRNNSHISISHTKGRVGIALSNRVVGLDIEVLGSRVGKVLPRILPKAYIRCIMSNPLAIRSDLEHLAWSGCEALYKLVEESTSITDFSYHRGSLKFNQTMNTIELVAFYYKNTNIPLYIKSYLFDGYIHTVSSYKPISDNLKFLKI